MTMHIALNHEQKLIHIDDAIRGLACECTCFCCHEQVIAKKGPTNEHHFAHVSEPTRLFRRQFILSHATLAGSSSWR